MTVPVCYYGSPEPLPPRRELRAGPLTAVYEAGDLRYVKVGGVEVCRRWYAAVRDHNWGTVPGVISNERIDELKAGFRVSYTSTHRRGDIHFVWRAEILAVAGSVTFVFDGEAKSDFRRNRIGICVLHPIRECAGSAATLHHPDGSTTATHFPRLIAPENPFKDLAGLTHALPDGGSAEWWFDGDVFETEDQRNWTDASFKTFSTPLRLPFPVDVKLGDRVRQTVTLTVSQPGTRATEAEGPSLALRADRAGALLPAVGVCVASHGVPLTEREMARLRLLRPAHVRVEVDLTAGGWLAGLRQAVSEAVAIGTTLELAVTVLDRAWDETAALIPVLQEVNPPVARVLAFHAREWATPVRVMSPLVEAFARWDASVPVFVGTTANFTELNRGRPQPTFSDGGLCYSIQPQEHAFDNASLMETCVAVADTVRSARAFCGDLPIAVTPITLRKRVNPYATGPAPPVPPDELPPTVDVRQVSLFGAGWTLATLKYLAESGVASVTFFETTGWLGVMEKDAGCPLPGKFLSRPGMVFPLFHVLADANEFAGGRVVQSVSSNPLAFDGLAIRLGDTTRVMLANLTERPQTVTVRGLPPEAVVRVLDEHSFDRATFEDPLGFRDAYGEPWLTRDGTLTIALHPYAYARFDCN